MSLTSLLLGFAPALAARLNPVPELEAENQRLKAELVDVKAGLEDITAQLEQARLELANRQRSPPLQQFAQNALAQQATHCDCSPSRSRALLGLGE
jgi:hypothetical protein